MRHWHLGYPLEGFSPVADRPCGHWITLFVLSYRETATGWTRIAWPDGGPLLDQTWRQVRVFEVIRDEFSRIVSELKASRA